jgi:oligopeptide transport system substrate-binding protein
LAPEVRRAFLIFAALAVLVAIGWASFFESIPPAQFSLQSGSDAKTLDPARATGNIEGRLLYELFEGLLSMMPEGEPDPETKLQAMTPQPGMASSFEISEDKRRYTFHLRDDIRWTDGTPVTSHDFAWSWLRLLHPATASEYTFHLYGVPFAQAYNQATVNIGDRVEVELWDRPGETPTSTANFQHFPRGTILYGTLREIRKPPEPTEQEKKNDEEADLNWRDSWVYHVDVATVGPDGVVDWDGETKPMTFAARLDPEVADAATQRTHGVLVAFDKLGSLETPDDRTFIVNLTDPIPYFPNIVAFYALFPINRKCVESHGSPMWTNAENVVTNGPYKLQMRRLRDRLRLVKNDDYYNAENVAMESIDFLSLEGQNTALNMYETGQIQWVTDPPSTLLDVLKTRPDFYNAPQLSVYLFRLNVSRPPLDNVLVRRAIAMAIDRKEIVEEVTQVGQIPAFTLVPPGLAGYESANGIEYNVTEARRLLEEAGFAGGRGIPKLTILYNTSEGHRSIAEVVQQQLQNNLNISIELQNMEWGSFLDKVQQTDYQIARAGWIADYPDPNTFLDMWVTNGPQNSTNWSNKRFDQLIADAAREGNSAKRLSILREAEQIWVDEMPVIPVYFYTSINIVKPNVKGFFPSAQDLHPLQLLRYEDSTDGKEQR